MSLGHENAVKMMQGMAAIVDNKISIAISKKLGKAWKVEGMKGRLTRTKHKDGTEVFALDGEGLLRFHPLVIRTELTPTGYAIKATQEFEEIFVPKEEDDEE